MSLCHISTPSPPCFPDSAAKDIELTTANLLVVIVKKLEKILPSSSDFRHERRGFWPPHSSLVDTHTKTRFQAKLP